MLVVGAGPTGLTMACELARHGAPVRIVDKLPGIVPYCRATGIHSRTLEIFHDLGVIDEVLAVGEELHAMKQFAGGELIQQVRLDAVDSRYPYTISLEQFRTEHILEELLGRLGVRVERNTELIAMTDRLDGVQATLRHGDGREELVEAPWLVACDGAHSSVRHLNRQHFPGDSDPRQFVVADVRLDPPLPRDEIQSHLAESGILLLFSIPGGRTLVVADIADHHDGAAEAPHLAEIQTLVSARGPANLRVGDPRWLGYFRIHYRLTPHYRHGRSFLAGDAAHIHSPVGGQGMNTGIQDAHNLAWKLALVTRGRAPRGLLDSYEEERRAVAADVVQGTRAMTEQLAALPNLPPEDRHERFLLASVPAAERLRLSRHREELDLDYRRSPICADHVRGSSAAAMAETPHAGAQAPDASPLRVAGRTCTLFDLLRGTRHIALLFSGTARRRARLDDLAASLAREYGDVMDVYIVAAERRAEAPPGVRVVEDTDDALRRRYGAGITGVYLIRPDGYVGFRSSTLARAALERHLERIFCT